MVIEVEKYLLEVSRYLHLNPGRKDELVALITSVEPSGLGATNWLRLNRDYWGIESGLHQRLDISHNDDRCRVRNDNATGELLPSSSSIDDGCST